MLTFVNVFDHNGFCFRGEGGANFVISAKNRRTGERIVWRFAKQRKSGKVSIKPKCHITTAYLENLIAPLISSEFLVKPRIVLLPIQHVHHLAKLPAFRTLKADTMADLVTATKCSSSVSRLPLDDCALAISQNIRCVTALEMSDLTFIPERIRGLEGHPTITVELKPKQGFFQQHPGVDLPFCNNCVMQIEKWKNAAYDKMYDFCPLDLFSGDLPRMQSALNSLFRDPHRNLRVFINGTMVYSDEAYLPERALDALLFPTPASGDVTSTLVPALCRILAGVPDPATPFGLSSGSVLGALLEVQQLDPIGIVTAHELYTSLAYSQQSKLHDKDRLIGKTIASFAAADPMSLLERYFCAATVKDCSVMVSLRQVPISEAIEAGSALLPNIVRVNRDLNDPNSDVFFAYSAKVVDLDPKTPKNLVNAFSRFMEGARFIRENPGVRRPCVPGHFPARPTENDNDN